MKYCYCNNKIEVTSILQYHNHKINSKYIQDNCHCIYEQLVQHHYFIGSITNQPTQSMEDNTKLQNVQIN